MTDFSQPLWQPNEADAKQTNLAKLMAEAGFDWDQYDDFHRWTVENSKAYWQLAFGEHGLNLAPLFAQKPGAVWDMSRGAEHVAWLPNATLNVADLALRNSAAAIIHQDAEGKINRLTNAKLTARTNQIANALAQSGLQIGDRVALALPITPDAVAFYLGAQKAGLSVVGLIDTDPPEQIIKRLDIAKPKLIFTQDNDRRHPLYPKIAQIAGDTAIIVAAQSGELTADLRPQDTALNDFLSPQTEFASIKRGVNDEFALYFSSGSTGAPKAIVWTQAQFLNLALEGLLVQDNRAGDVAIGSSRLGWMMGPHQIFATLPNGAAMAFTSAGGAGQQFADFVQDTHATSIMAVPAHFKHWRDGGYMQSRDLSNLRSIHYTGEAASPELAAATMNIRSPAIPVCAYCGGTELAGGYAIAVPIKPITPARFNAIIPAIDAQIYTENNQLVADNEVGSVYFLGPGLGWSTTLLNKDHHAEYYADTPKAGLRAHGDLLMRAASGDIIHRGRSDGLGNPNGVKTSPTEIESLINEKMSDIVGESAAIFVIPPNSGGTERMVIYAAPKDDLARSKKSIKTAMSTLTKTHHSPYVDVYDVVMLDKLPRNAAGKLLHKQMRGDYQQQLDQNSSKTV